MIKDLIINWLWSHPVETIISVCIILLIALMIIKGSMYVIIYVFTSLPVAVNTLLIRYAINGTVFLPVALIVGCISIICTFLSIKLHKFRLILVMWTCINVILMVLLIYFNFIAPIKKLDKAANLFVDVTDTFVI